MRLLEPTLSLQTATMRRSVSAQCDQGLGEGLAAIEHGGLGGVHHASSFSASFDLAGEGTLWCHSTRSSMKETPLPLMVRAMMQRGRPSRGKVSAS